MKNPLMLKGYKVYIILFGLPILMSCSDPSTGEINMEPAKLTYNLEKFNDLSTFFILDSINESDHKITIHFTDTSKFYQPERHIQNYSLTFLTSLDQSMLTTEIDSITFDVTMVYRPEGDIVQTYSRESILPIIQRFTDPNVKEKIIALNKYNKQDYISRTGDKNLDVLYKLNMYFAQIIDPSSWVGVDSYEIIWGYEYNKAGGYNKELQEHQDAFNKILTDTLYMKERTVGKEVYKILTK